MLDLLDESRLIVIRFWCELSAWFETMGLGGGAM